MRDLKLRLFNGDLYVYDANDDEIDIPVKYDTKIEGVEVEKFFQILKVYIKLEMMLIIL